jgi:predicted transcriptional regulator
MPNRAISLRLPSKLRDRIDKLAEQGGQTPQALIVRALETCVESLERHEAFVRDALQAKKEMEESGVAYAAEDVHEYLRARLKGRKVRRPKPVPWRG